MPSFDVVSRLDSQEIDNAISNVLREISTRYDFKGSQTTVERKDKDLTVVTDDELKLSQVHELIVTHLVRRKVDPLTLQEGSKEKAGGDKIRQIYKLNEGIEQSIAKISFCCTPIVMQTHEVKHFNWLHIKCYREWCGRGVVLCHLDAPLTLTDKRDSQFTCRCLTVNRHEMYIS